MADLKARKVTTLFGTGQKARSYNIPGTGLQVDLNSPWDLLAHQGKLYIAMAGPHQLWTADLKTLEAKPYAGSGREARVDATLLEAALAQPSGITTDGKKLYFADSETSSIRSADLNPGGRVETIIGEDLFDYGDIDGPASRARLQHALGVLFHEGKLYVADTYNSKIKEIDPAKKTSVTFSGTGKHGTSDGEKSKAEFNEPGGLAILGNKLYIADTNNHQIRILDLSTQTVSTLELMNKEILAKKSMKDFKGRVVEYPAQNLGKGAGSINLTYRLPAGFKFTKGAPFYLHWKSGDESILKFGPSPEKVDFTKASFPYKIPVETSAGSTEAVFDAIIYYCRENSTLCVFDSIRVKVPLAIADKGTHELAMEIEVQNPDRKKLQQEE